MKSLRLKSPSKINLYLRLMGKRRDGFNNIITIFQRLDLSDHIEFKRVKSGFRIECDHPEVPKGTQNLIYKAYSLIKKKTKLKGGLHVKLKKHIPVKAGLGGASGNAAMTLIALNRLYKLNLGKDTLLDLGAKLGSDVPFFLTRDKLALGIDRGEKTLKLNGGKQKKHVILFVFQEGLSTKKVYKKYRYPRNPVRLTKILREAIMIPLFLRGRDLSAIAKISYNDLLKPAGTLKPEIFSLMRRLKKMDVPLVQMTGSGATVFAMVSNKKQVQKVYRSFSSDKKITLLTTHSG